MTPQAMNWESAQRMADDLRREVRVPVLNNAPTTTLAETSYRLRRLLTAIAVSVVGVAIVFLSFNHVASRIP